ncbi:MAG: TlpA family protein disulfide reductase [Bacteroidales bacterium]|nr:TlpA family protein disulfide reductase [Bacteroidales bacterium]
MTVKKHVILLFAALVSFFGTISAEEVRLRGMAPDYAGLNIEIERYADFVTHQKQTLSVLKVNDEGRFDCGFDLGEITYAFLELGSFRAYIYLEPGTSYEVVLPPFAPRPDADRFNPFFVPEVIELGIVNETGCLNEAIRNYDLFFNEIYNQNAIRMVRLRDRKLADALIARSDSVALAQQCDNEYFKQYVHYRNVQIYATPRLQAYRSVLSTSFVQSDVAYNVPSYWDALDLIGRNFVSTFMRTKYGRKMAADVKIYSEIEEAVKKDSLFGDNQKFREALILKGIYDDFYSDFLTSGQTDTLLATASNQLKHSENIELALNMLAKKNRLKIGTEAPDFTLFDMEGNEVSLHDFKNKFVYLAFLHTQNFACAKDIPALSGLSRKYRNDMVVVGIMTDEDVDNLPKFVSKRKINWTVLSFSLMQSVMLDYSVESLPAYFLVDPEGKIALTSAPAPSESVEKALSTEIKRYRTEYLKRNPQKPRDIYDAVRYGH